MAASDIKSVDDYIISKSETVQETLKRVRAAILAALPDADESISYKMPVYKINGVAVIYFAGWKRHYSVYPASDRVVAAFKDELVPYEIDNGTIRFPLSEPVPEELIARIAKFRAKEVAERKTSPPAPPLRQ